MSGKVPSVVLLSSSSSNEGGAEEDDEDCDDETIDVVIRKVEVDDHVAVVELFHENDVEKFDWNGSKDRCENMTKTEALSGFQNCNNNNNINVQRKSFETSASAFKSNLSLAGLRIDERGGIYLNPLLDCNSAYFKCFVAENTTSALTRSASPTREQHEEQALRSPNLVGYVLFFNTLDDEANKGPSGLRTAASSLAGLPGGSCSSDDPVAVIEDLFVRPRYRRLGIATQLWKKVIKSSLDRGCFSCESSVLKNNEAGQAFWKRRLGPKKYEDALTAEPEKHVKNGGDLEVRFDLSRADMISIYEDT